MNEKNKLRFQIFKNNLKIRLIKISIFWNNVKIKYNLFKMSLLPLRQKLIIYKFKLRMFFNNFLLFLRIPAIIILGTIVPLLALLNLFNVREMLVRMVKGEITKHERDELLPKFMEVVNHLSFIFYILLLYFMIW